MFEFEPESIAKPLLYSFWAIVLYVFIVFTLKMHLRKNDFLDGAPKNKFFRRIYLYAHFFLGTIANCALISILFFPVFLKMFIYNCIISLPVVMITLRRYLRSKRMRRY